jgi:hypothetical protein
VVQLSKCTAFINILCDIALAFFQQGALWINATIAILGFGLHENAFDEIGLFTVSDILFDVLYVFS